MLTPPMPMSAGVVLGGKMAGQCHSTVANRVRVTCAAVAIASLLAVAVLAPVNEKQHISSPTELLQANAQQGKVAPLDAVRQREEIQSDSHDDAVMAALKAHVRASEQLSERRIPKADKLQQPEQGADFSAHPWDLINPTSGQSNQQLAQTSSPNQGALRADQVMDGGGTVDPRAMLDLSEGLKEHDQQDNVEPKHHRVHDNQYQEAQHQSQPVWDARQEARTHIQAKAAVLAKGGNQGFVTGDHLRVSAEEYHREMKQYMPSADGRLVSPFKWFQGIGKDVQKKAAPTAS